MNSRNSESWWPNVWSRNLEAMRSPRQANRRSYRLTAELTGWQSSIRYSGSQTGIPQILIIFEPVYNIVAHFQRLLYPCFQGLEKLMKLFSILCNASRTYKSKMTGGSLQTRNTYISLELCLTNILILFNFFSVNFISMFSLCKHMRLTDVWIKQLLTYLSNKGILIYLLFVSRHLGFLNTACMT